MPRPKRKAKGTSGAVYPLPDPSGSTPMVRLTGAYGDALSRIVQAESASKPRRNRRPDEGKRRNRYQRQATAVELGSVADPKPAPDNSVSAVTVAWVGGTDLQQVADSQVLQTALERWTGRSNESWTVQTYSDNPNLYQPREGKLTGTQWPESD